MSQAVERNLNQKAKFLMVGILVAVITGFLLRSVVGLTPVWWLVWVVPVPMLILAYRSTRAEARWLVALCALIGTSVNFHYYCLVMPVTWAVVAVVAQALLWVFVVLATRTIVVRYRAWWTIVVYPVLWVAVDTLMAAILPDGNWGSLAYSQADVLPLVQVTALLGIPGLLFLLTLIPSAIALALSYGRDVRSGWVAYSLTAILFAAAASYGVIRLRSPIVGTETKIGLAAIDDAIGLQATGKYVANILRQYADHVASLAARGAQIIVLPEKIAVVTLSDSQAWQQQLGAMAAARKVWLLAGIGVKDSDALRNLAWLFAPDGRQVATYEKQHLAPPERRSHYTAGRSFTLIPIAGYSYGIAICKDMHFASLGRAYGDRQAAVMLVPAWDFNFLDEWLESRSTTMRGVENGYAVVRAGRESLLSVTDPYGRVIAERESRPLPGVDLLATLRVSPPMATVYTKLGNVLGWLCVAGGAMFFWIGRYRRGRGEIGARDTPIY
jgi:apolipoprotein N-acyltransferase